MFCGKKIKSQVQGLDNFCYIVLKAPRYVTENRQRYDLLIQKGPFFFWLTQGPNQFYRQLSAVNRFTVSVFSGSVGKGSPLVDQPLCLDEPMNEGQ